MPTVENPYICVAVCRMETFVGQDISKFTGSKVPRFQFKSLDEPVQKSLNPGSKAIRNHIHSTFGLVSFQFLPKEW